MEHFSHILLYFFSGCCHAVRAGLPPHRVLNCYYLCANACNASATRVGCHAKPPRPKPCTTPGPGSKLPNGLNSSVLEKRASSLCHWLKPKARCTDTSSGGESLSSSPPPPQTIHFFDLVVLAATSWKPSDLLKEPSRIRFLG